MPTAPSPGAFGGASGSSFTVTAPAGVTTGTCVLVSFWAYWPTTSTVPTSAAVTPPTDWDLSAIHGGWVDNADGGCIWQAFYYHYAAGPETSYQFTPNSVGGTTFGAGSAQAVIVTGGPTSGDPFSSDAPVTFQSADTHASVPTFTPGGDNSLLLANIVGTDQVVTINAPSGWTNLTNTDDGNGDTECIAYAQQTTAAATGTVTFTFTGSGTLSWGVLIGAIRPPSGSPPPGPTKPGLLVPRLIVPRIRASNF